jgi:hypothetical protein
MYTIAMGDIPCYHLIIVANESGDILNKLPAFRLSRRLVSGKASRLEQTIGYLLLGVVVVAGAVFMLQIFSSNI